MVEDTKEAILKALEVIDHDLCSFRSSKNLKRAFAISGSVVACVAEYPEKYDVVACTIEHITKYINLGYLISNLNKQSDITFKVETDELPELLWHNGHFGMVTSYISPLKSVSYNKDSDNQYDDIREMLLKRLESRIAHV